MTLYAKTAITGPNGEQVDRDMPIPAAWPVDGEFVREGIEHGWIVNRDDTPPVAPLPATPPPAAAEAEPTPVSVGGRGNREGTA